MPLRSEPASADAGSESLGKNSRAKQEFAPKPEYAPAVVNNTAGIRVPLPSMEYNNACKQYSAGMAEAGERLETAEYKAPEARTEKTIRE